MAYDAIVIEGPASPINFSLSNLVRMDNHLRWYLEGAGEFLSRRLYAECPPKLVDDVAKSMIAAALVAGLNYGLRIGEARGLPKKG